MTNNRTDLEALAVRVEAAEAADRNLDYQLDYFRCDWPSIPPPPTDAEWLKLERLEDTPAPFTGDISTALRLAPDFPHLLMLKELWNGPGTENGKSTLATIQRYGKTMWTGDYTGLAATPALALCAAALRARSAS